MQVVALLLSLYHPADLMALKFKVCAMHKNAMTRLWKMSKGKFWSKFVPSAENKYSGLKTLFLVCFTLVETEGLTRGYPLSMQPELPIRNCVLSSDAPSHEIRQGNGNPMNDENGILGIKPG